MVEVDPPVACTPMNLATTTGRALGEGFGAAVPVLGERQAEIADRLVEIGVTRRAMDRLHIRPGEVQFLGDQGGQGRLDPLPHLGARRDDGDAVPGDQDIGVEGRRAPAGVGVGSQWIVRVLAILVIAKGDAADDRRRADQEGAAGDLGKPAHRATPRMRVAASWMAARMRG